MIDEAKEDSEAEDVCALCDNGGNLLWYEFFIMFNYTNILRATSKSSTKVKGREYMVIALNIFYDIFQGYKL